MRAEAPVLVVAGSDPLGYSGLQADLRHLAAVGVPARGIPSCLTIQGPRSLVGIQRLDPDQVVRSVRLAMETEPVPAALKIGLVHDPDLALRLGDLLESLAPPVVLDPVLAAGAGASLWCGDGVSALRDHLLSRASLLTPNLEELAALAGAEVGTDAGRVAAARGFLGARCRHVLVKGGHDAGEATEVCDRLVSTERVEEFTGRRVPGADVRGTGCALSTLIAAGLARGRGVSEAVGSARGLVARGIEAAVARGSRWLVVEPDPD